MATVSRVDRLTSPSRWQLSPALAAFWPHDEAWPITRWLAEGAARIVKRGPQRTVFRVDLPGLAFYVKQHHLPDQLTWWRQRFRAPKARREFDRLTEFARRGVPAPQPLGWGVRASWSGVGESFVVTRAIDDVAPLNRIFVESELTSRQRQELAAALGRFLAKLHDAGVNHRDLHTGNIVGRAAGAGYELFLVDLDAVHLGRTLARGRSFKNLALFAAGCLQATERPDRLRFLRSYAAARGWIDPTQKLASDHALFDLARVIEHDAWRYCLRFWAHRDRRCVVRNRYYQTVSGRQHSGMAIRGMDDEWLARFARDPEALFHNARILKHSKTSTVAEITAVIEGAPRSAIVKKIGATRWTDPLAALARATPILRSWIAGQGFLERNLPTPRPLAMLHRRRGGLLHEGYLVTEKLDNVQELDRYIDGLSALTPSDRQRRLRRQIERVARAVRAMHRRHISHRDLKAANLLVNAIATEDTPAGAPRPIWPSPFPVAATTLWFIDLVGVTRHKHLTKRRRVQNLSRLNASFYSGPALTRTDRLRFLRIYLGWGIHGKGDWKAWWRAVAAATAAKAERNRKSGRVLG
jgi:tRNA A-37 threonylcarbamoyl transferase component Bud32